jgi:glyoxylase-like metal-dependent hydrolase (beta-lactamase superfamily II)
MTMPRIPLEDTVNDILGKAQRGRQWSDPALAQAAGLSAEDLGRVRAGTADEEALRKLAAALGLCPEAVVASARQRWYPEAVSLDGLRQFNTPYEDMTVNSYLVWDPSTGRAAAFDTGATCAPMLDAIRQRGLRIEVILLTHTHADHIADLERLQRETGAPAWVSRLEPVPGAEPFDAGRNWTVGALRIESRQTWGHSRGGITYVVNGLARPVAVVGDALFAGSMGGGGVSYADALATNRQHIFSLPDAAVVCPGHGPLTSVGEEKHHNPFYPEYQPRPATT